MMSRKLWLCGGLFLGFITGLTYTSGAQSRTTGTVTGRTRDQKTNELLIGANVRIKGTSIGAVSNLEGRYTLKNVPVGPHAVVASYVGYKTIEITIDVEPGKITEQLVTLEDNFVEMKGITVSGYRGGQASALSQQQSANNIKNVVSSNLIESFPDNNTAEALQRVPAISIQRDQGEGRYIQIRGTDPRLSNISINGVQIPSPEADIRYAALDVIPSDMLSGIEVTKAITPDMDGDAIGGSVNLNTLQAINPHPAFHATIGSGYNNKVQYLSRLQSQMAASYGQRFGKNDRLGFTIGASYSVADRGNDDNENEYNDGALETVEIRDYNLRRIRLGVTSMLDYKLNEHSHFYFSGIYNYFADQEYAGEMSVETDKIKRELKDRFEAQTIANISAGATHQLSHNFELNYKLSYSYAQENTAPEIHTNYVQEFEDPEGESIEFMGFTPDDKYPQYFVRPDAPAGAGSLEYGNFKQDEYEYTDQLTNDQNLEAKLDMKSFYQLDSHQGSLKLGGYFGGSKRWLILKKDTIRIPVIKPIAIYLVILKRQAFSLGSMISAIFLIHRKIVTYTIMNVPTSNGTVKILLLTAGQKITKHLKIRVPFML